MVLCFNQVGRGYEVMWPRLLDTLIGAGIAALAIHVIQPDWQGRRFNQVLADTLRCDARYLARILGQYTSGKRDDLDYRIARRDAHNADATLSGVLSNMLREPGRHRQGGEALLRFLGTAHSLLGHLSALGANRQALIPGAARDVVTRAGKQTIDALERLAQILATRSAAMPNGHEQALAEALGAIDTDDETARLVLGQLALVLAQRDRLAALVEELPAE